MQSASRRGNGVSAQPNLVGVPGHEDANGSAFDADLASVIHLEEIVPAALAEPVTLLGCLIAHDHAEAAALRPAGLAKSRGYGVAGSGVAGATASGVGTPAVACRAVDVACAPATCAPGS